MAPVNAGNLYYEVSGRGTPMIFLHGFACDHRNWEPQVKAFSKNYKVVTYDARGHGQSSVPGTEPYDYAEDLEALMDYLSIDKAVIIGHSMGGGPAFFFAHDHPERTLGLVLVEGGPFLSDPELIDTTHLQDLMKSFHEAYRIRQEEGLERGKEAWMEIEPLRHSLQNPISSDRVRIMITDYSGWHWQHTDPHKKRPQASIQLLGEIKVPTLVFLGELSHPAYDDATAVWARYIPESKRVTIRNASHMINLENPEQFNTELEIFLKEHDIR